MNNLSFLPENVKHKHENRNIKKYKIAFLTLWILCVFMLLAFIFNFNKYKNVKEKYLKENNNKRIAPENKADRNLDTIKAFNKFIESFEKGPIYNNVEISGKKIHINLIVKENSEILELMDFIENKLGYKILLFSPYSKENNEDSIEIIFEV